MRRTVEAFAERMEEVLADNDYKGGWEDCDDEYLLGRLLDEMAELRMAVRKQVGVGKLGLSESIGKEAIDVANFAMMMACKYEPTVCAAAIRDVEDVESELGQ